MSEINRYNGISEKDYETLREAVKTSPRRKQKIHNTLKEEVKHPTEGGN
jgi:hypothetical protein